MSLEMTKLNVESDEPRYLVMNPELLQMYVGGLDDALDVYSSWLKGEIVVEGKETIFQFILENED